MFIAIKNYLLCFLFVTMFVFSLSSCGGGGSSSSTGGGNTSTAEGGGATATSLWLGIWSLVSVNGVLITDQGITSFVYTAAETTWSFVMEITGGTTCTASGTWAVDIEGNGGSVSSVTTASEGCTVSVGQEDMGTIDFSEDGNTMTVTITSGNVATSVYTKQ